MPRLKILFVCGKNLKRSPTAEAIFRTDSRVSVRSAGVSEKSRRRVNESDLEWADLVLVMERKHAARLRAAIPHCDDLASIESLDIPDDHDFIDPELIELLRTALEGHIERLSG
jgi:predicted protein tyrosine phosphatase